MKGMAFRAVVALVAASLLSSVASSGPIVTLSHGGELEGRSVAVSDSKVDQFLGLLDLFSY